MTNAVYGRLTVKYYLGSAADGSGPVWRCQCECGGWIKVRAKQLRHGDTKSCGCLRREYQRWQGAEGFNKVISRLAGDVSEVTSDDFSSVLRLTKVLVDRFGQVNVAKALRHLRSKGH